MKDGNKKTSILGYSAVRLCDHIVIDGSINTWTRQNCRCKTSDTRHSKPLSIYSERHITIAVIVVCNLVQKQQVHKHFYKATKLFLTNTEKYTFPSTRVFICPLVQNRWCIGLVKTTDMTIYNVLHMITPNGADNNEQDITGNSLSEPTWIWRLLRLN